MRWIKSVIAIKEFPLLRVKRNFDEIIRFAMKYAVLWFSLFYKNISKVWYEIKTFSYQLLLLKSLTYLKIATLLLSFKYQMSWETYEKRKNPIQLYFTNIYMPLSRNLETNIFLWIYNWWFIFWDKPNNQNFRYEPLCIVSYMMPYCM